MASTDRKDPLWMFRDSLYKVESSLPAFAIATNTPARSRLGISLLIKTDIYSSQFNALSLPNEL
jgi:hypothetical protein